MKSVSDEVKTEILSHHTDTHSFYLSLCSALYNRFKLLSEKVAENYCVIYLSGN